jgi:very-short-patch-repair endonuclease
MGSARDVAQEWPAPHRHKPIAPHDFIVDRSAAFEPDVACAHTAAAQFGVLSFEQALSAGLTPSALKHRRARGRLKSVLPHVYAVGGAPSSLRRDLMAACLWAGPGSAASHRAAAHLRGWDGFEAPPIEISTISRRKPIGLDLIAHRVDRHLLDEMTSIAGIPVTSVRRTLLDLAGIKHPRREGSLDRALRDGATTIAEISRLYEQEWTRGRRGIAILRNMLIERTPGDACSDSQLEMLLARLIRREALPEPVRQFPVELSSRTVHLDFAYRQELLDLETDGYAWHMDRESFERDRARDNELAELGWLVLRFTYAMLRWEPDRVAQTIRTNLHNRRSSVQWSFEGAIRP